MSRTNLSLLPSYGGGASLVILLIFLDVTLSGAEVQSLKKPATEFNKHSIVLPTANHARTKREISTTRDNINGAHHPEVVVSIPVETEQLVLDLHLNEHLLTEGHTLNYQLEGDTFRYTPTREELDLCHYSGSVRDKPQSWVAVSTCHGVRGVIFDGEKMRYIEPAHDSSILSPHYLYDHNDLNSEYQKSSRENVMSKNNPRKIDNHVDYSKIKKSRISRYKRNTENQTDVPYSLINQHRYVELVMIADHSEFLKHGGNIRSIHRQLIQLVNIVNTLYVPLNIHIALVGVEVWSQTDYIHVSKDNNSTLENFSLFRETSDLNSRIPNDVAFLFTGIKFEDGVLGIASGGKICGIHSTGVCSDYSEVLGLVAATLAHEIGHVLGMVHDDEHDKCDCLTQRCIMHSSIDPWNPPPMQWNPCNVYDLEENFASGADSCLQNKPSFIFSSPSCGNGFIDPGEQCDCGVTVEGVRNKQCYACCNPDTCMLRSNATCAAGECCDLTSCSLKPLGAMCRPADRECDLSEYCSGQSAFCPENVYKMDTTPCSTGEDQAYCMHGYCRSHSDECRLLWGSSAKSSPQCYLQKNVVGDEAGHCGIVPGSLNTSNYSAQYKKCSTSDVSCGLLQCNYGPIMFKIRNTRVTALLLKDLESDCRIATFLDVYDVLGFVPDGAKCGENHMCLNRKCVSVAEVQEISKKNESSVCPFDCSGHGVCNSKGNCHCDAGFAPPLCALPGLGGSFDSGPATGSRPDSNGF